MISLSQLTDHVHLDQDLGLDLVIASVGLGKDSLPRSRKMTSDLEIEGERSIPEQQNIKNPLGRAQKPNFISKHKVILHCSQICYLRYAKVYQLHL